MGTKKIVPLRPVQPKGPTGTLNKPLTLADIAIAWEAPGYTSGTTRTRYVDGPTLAMLVAQLAYRCPSPSGYGLEPQMVGTYLRGLSYIVFPDAGTPTEDVEKDVRFTVSEFLENAAALLHAEHTDATRYRVHVGPIPEEWKQ
jgi:hypothetical protein